MGLEIEMPQEFEVTCFQEPGDRLTTDVRHDGTLSINCVSSSTEEDVSVYLTHYNAKRLRDWLSNYLVENPPQPTETKLKHKP